MQKRVLGKGGEASSSLAADDKIQPDFLTSVEAVLALMLDEAQTTVALMDFGGSQPAWLRNHERLDNEERSELLAFARHIPEACGILKIDEPKELALIAASAGAFTIPYLSLVTTIPIIPKGQRFAARIIFFHFGTDLLSDNDIAKLWTILSGLIGQKSLRDQVEISQLIGETSTDAFVCCDPQGLITYWNAAAERMFGWSTTEAIGRHLDLIVPVEHLDAHNRGMARLKSGASPRLVGKTVEVPAERRCGSRIQVELSLGMWRDRTTSAPAGFISVMRDITDRKQSEALLAERMAAIEAANDGIAIIDKDGRFTFMNAAHLDLFGFADPSEVLGRPWSDLYEADNALRLQRIAFPILEERGRWTGEVVGRRVDGRAVEQEISFSLQANGQGLVCVTRDTSQRRRIGREKALLREQLLTAQRQETISHLAAGLAHDFSNLIASISGSAAVLEISASSESLRHIRRISAAADEATSLVSKMLTLGARHQELKKQDLRDIVEAVADLLASSLRDDQFLDLDVPDVPVMATVDRTEVMQVLLNLAINARDALIEGKISHVTIGVANASASSAPVVVGAMPLEPSARLFVADNGHGIDGRDIDRIFRPYYTRKSQNGTGLGLAVVAGLVTSAGGAIEVNSSGEGTCFNVYWPLETSVRRDCRVTDALAFPDQVGIAGKHFIIVDDDEDALHRLVEIFEQAGAEVLSCGNPLDALREIRDDPHAWAALITDFDMPSLTGAELARRARLVRPNLPILLCTALPHAPRTELGLFDGVVGKIASPEILLATTQLAVRNRKGEAIE